MNLEKSLTELLKIIRNIEDDKRLKKFLLGLLTPGEIEEIERRIKIVKMLKKGIPQQKIAEELGVGIATVTRGSKEIKLGRFEDVS